MAGKVHLLPTAGILTGETQVYTQRISDATQPEPFKFTLAQLIAFLDANGGKNVTVNPTPLSYIPANSNNPAMNYNQVVIASNKQTYFIDNEGRAHNFNKTAGDIEITDATKGIIMNGKRGRFTDDGTLITEDK